MLIAKVVNSCTCKIKSIKADSFLSSNYKG